jgi:GNAT superfamily N-acetyltransferase
MAASEANPLALVALTPADVDGGLALSGGAGWNQTADDWALFIEQGHAIGFRTTASGELIATAASIIYSGGLGWISMVLVAHDWRHRGLASLLLEACIKRLQLAHLTPVLDATPAGEPVYRHLGFRAGFELERWQGVVAGNMPAPPDAAGVRPAGAADLDAIAALDQGANGIGRRALLQNIFARHDTQAWMPRDGSGFLMARSGRRATQLGPLVARDAAGAIALLAAALHAIVGPIFLDVPKRWPELASWLEQVSFVRQRRYVRMSLGSAAALACGDRTFVLAGPEFG